MTQRALTNKNNNHLPWEMVVAEKLLPKTGDDLLVKNETQLQ
jgi:hypothetical protein